MAHGRGHGRGLEGTPKDQILQIWFSTRISISVSLLQKAQHVGEEQGFAALVEQINHPVQTRTKETVTLDVVKRSSKSFQCFAGRRTGCCSLLNDLSFGSQEGHWQSHLLCSYQFRVQTPTMLEQPKRGSLLQWILPENSTLRARNELAIDLNYETEADIVFTDSSSLGNKVLTTGKTFKWHSDPTFIILKKTSPQAKRHQHHSLSLFWLF